MEKSLLLVFFFFWRQKLLPSLEGEEMFAGKYK